MLTHSSLQGSLPNFAPMDTDAIHRIAEQHLPASINVHPVTFVEGLTRALSGEYPDHIVDAVTDSAFERADAARRAAILEQL